MPYTVLYMYIMHYQLLQDSIHQPYHQCIIRSPPIPIIPTSMPQDGVLTISSPAILIISHTQEMQPFGPPKVGSMKKTSSFFDFGGSSFQIDDFLRLSRTQKVNILSFLSGVFLVSWAPSQIEHLANQLAGTRSQSATLLRRSSGPFS